MSSPDTGGVLLSGPCWCDPGASGIRYSLFYDCTGLHLDWSANDNTNSRYHCQMKLWKSAVVSAMKICQNIPAKHQLHQSNMRHQTHCSLAPGGYGSTFKSIIFRLITQNSSLGTWCEIVFRWMPQNLINRKSTLVQVMAWYCLVTSHHLSQCWPRSMLPKGGFTRSQ